MGRFDDIIDQAKNVLWLQPKPAGPQADTKLPAGWWTHITAPDKYNQPEPGWFQWQPEKPLWNVEDLQKRISDLNFQVPTAEPTVKPAPVTPELDLDKAIKEWTEALQKWPKTLNPREAVWLGLITPVPEIYQLRKSIEWVSSQVGKRKINEATNKDANTQHQNIADAFSWFDMLVKPVTEDMKWIGVPTWDKYTNIDPERVSDTSKKNMDMFMKQSTDQTLAGWLYTPDQYNQQVLKAYQGASSEILDNFNALNTRLTNVIKQWGLSPEDLRNFYTQNLNQFTTSTNDILQKAHLTATPLDTDTVLKLLDASAQFNNKEVDSNKLFTTNIDSIKKQYGIKDKQPTPPADIDQQKKIDSIFSGAYASALANTWWGTAMEKQDIFYNMSNSYNAFAQPIMDTYAGLQQDAASRRVDPAELSGILTPVKEFKDKILWDTSTLMAEIARLRATWTPYVTSVEQAQKNIGIDFVKEYNVSPYNIFSERFIEKKFNDKVNEARAGLAANATARFMNPMMPKGMYYNIILPTLTSDPVKLVDPGSYTDILKTGPMTSIGLPELEQWWYKRFNNLVDVTNFIANVYLIIQSSKWIIGEGWLGKILKGESIFMPKSYTQSFLARANTLAWRPIQDYGNRQRSLAAMWLDSANGFLQQTAMYMWIDAMSNLYQPKSDKWFNDWLLLNSVLAWAAELYRFKIGVDILQNFYPNADVGYAMLWKWLVSYGWNDFDIANASAKNFEISKNNPVAGIYAPSILDNTKWYFVTVSNDGRVIIREVASSTAEKATAAEWLPLFTQPTAPTYTAANEHTIKNLWDSLMATSTMTQAEKEMLAKRTIAEASIADNVMSIGGISDKTDPVQIREALLKLPYYANLINTAMNPEIPFGEFINDHYNTTDKKLTNATTFDDAVGTLKTKPKEVLPPVILKTDVIAPTQDQLVTQLTTKIAPTDPDLAIKQEIIKNNIIKSVGPWYEVNETAIKVLSPTANIKPEVQKIVNTAINTAQQWMLDNKNSAVFVWKVWEDWFTIVIQRANDVELKNTDIPKYRIKIQNNIYTLESDHKIAETAEYTLMAQKEKWVWPNIMLNVWDWEARTLQMWTDKYVIWDISVNYADLAKMQEEAAMLKKEEAKKRFQRLEPKEWANAFVNAMLDKMETMDKYIPASPEDIKDIAKYDTYAQIETIVDNLGMAPNETNFIINNLLITSTYKWILPLLNDSAKKIQQFETMAENKAKMWFGKMTYIDAEWNEVSTLEYKMIQEPAYTNQIAIQKWIINDAIAAIVFDSPVYKQHFLNSVAKYNRQQPGVLDNYKKALIYNSNSFADNFMWGFYDDAYVKMLTDYTPEQAQSYLDSNRDKILKHFQSEYLKRTVGDILNIWDNGLETALKKFKWELDPKTIKAEWMLAAQNKAYITKVYADLDTSLSTDQKSKIISAKSNDEKLEAINIFFEKLIDIHNRNLYRLLGKWVDVRDNQYVLDILNNYVDDVNTLDKTYDIVVEQIKGLPNIKKALPLDLNMYAMTLLTQTAKNVTPYSVQYAADIIGMLNSTIKKIWYVPTRTLKWVRDYTKIIDHLGANMVTAEEQENFINTYLALLPYATVEWVIDQKFLTTYQKYLKTIKWYDDTYPEDLAEMNLNNKTELDKQKRLQTMSDELDNLSRIREDMGLKPIDVDGWNRKIKLAKDPETVFNNAKAQILSSIDPTEHKLRLLDSFSSNGEWLLDKNDKIVFIDQLSDPSSPKAKRYKEMFKNNYIPITKKNFTHIVYNPQTDDLKQLIAEAGDSLIMTNVDKLAKDFPQARVLKPIGDIAFGVNEDWLIVGSMNADLLRAKLDEVQAGLKWKWFDLRVDKADVAKVNEAMNEYFLSLTPDLNGIKTALGILKPTDALTNMQAYFNLSKTMSWRPMSYRITDPTEIRRAIEQNLVTETDDGLFVNNDYLASLADQFNLTLKDTAIVPLAKKQLLSDYLLRTIVWENNLTINAAKIWMLKTFFIDMTAENKLALQDYYKQRFLNKRRLEGKRIDFEGTIKNTSELTKQFDMNNKNIQDYIVGNALQDFFKKWMIHQNYQSNIIDTFDWLVSTDEANIDKEINSRLSESVFTTADAEGKKQVVDFLEQSAVDPKMEKFLANFFMLNQDTLFKYAQKKYADTALVADMRLEDAINAPTQPGFLSKDEIERREWIKLTQAEYDGLTEFPSTSKYYEEWTSITIKLDNLLQEWKYNNKARAWISLLYFDDIIKAQKKWADMFEKLSLTTPVEKWLLATDNAGMNFALGLKAPAPLTTTLKVIWGDVPPTGFEKPTEDFVQWLKDSVKTDIDAAIFNRDLASKTPIESSLKWQYQEFYVNNFRDSVSKHIDHLNELYGVGSKQYAIIKALKDWVYSEFENFRINSAGTVIKTEKLLATIDNQFNESIDKLAALKLKPDMDDLVKFWKTYKMWLVEVDGKAVYLPVEITTKDMIEQLHGLIDPKFTDPLPANIDALASQKQLLLQKSLDYLQSLAASDISKMEIDNKIMYAIVEWLSPNRISYGKNQIMWVFRFLDRNTYLTYDETSVQKNNLDLLKQVLPTANADDLTMINVYTSRNIWNWLMYGFKNAEDFITNSVAQALDTWRESQGEDLISTKASRLTEYKPYIDHIVDSAIWVIKPFEDPELRKIFTSGHTLTNAIRISEAGKAKDYLRRMIDAGEDTAQKFQIMAEYYDYKAKYDPTYALRKQTLLQYEQFPDKINQLASNLKKELPGKIKFAEAEWAKIIPELRWQKSMQQLIQEFKDAAFIKYRDQLATDLWWWKPLMNALVNNPGLQKDMEKIYLSNSKRTILDELGNPIVSAMNTVVIWWTPYTLPEVLGTKVLDNEVSKSSMLEEIERLKEEQKEFAPATEEYLSIQNQIDVIDKELTLGTSFTDKLQKFQPRQGTDASYNKSLINYTTHELTDIWGKEIEPRNPESAYEKYSKLEAWEVAQKEIIGMNTRTELPDVAKPADKTDEHLRDDITGQWPIKPYRDPCSFTLD